jgi:hypothetical protein
VGQRLQAFGKRWRSHARVDCINVSCVHLVRPVGVPESFCDYRPRTSSHRRLTTVTGQKRHFALPNTHSCTRSAIIADHSDFVALIRAKSLRLLSDVNEPISWHLRSKRALISSGRKLIDKPPHRPGPAMHASRMHISDVGTGLARLSVPSSRRSGDVCSPIYRVISQASNPHMTSRDGQSRSS